MGTHSCYLRQTSLEESLRLRVTIALVPQPGWSPACHPQATLSPTVVPWNGWDPTKMQPLQLRNRETMQSIMPLPTTGIIHVSAITEIQHLIKSSSSSAWKCLLLHFCILVLWRLRSALSAVLSWIRVCLGRLKPNMSSSQHPAISPLRTQLHSPTAGRFRH